jgi:hypothetical protein
MSEAVTVERLEAGLAFLAYLVVRDGPVVIPLFEKLERELEAMRETENTVERARHLLTRRAIEPPDSQLAHIQNLIAGNVELPRYVERTHRDGIFSFSFRAGHVCIPLPDPTTAGFRRAYSEALVTAIAQENDNEEVTS